MMNIGILGCGNMGSAIAAQLASSGKYVIRLNDADVKKSGQVAENLSVTSVGFDDLLEESDIIILAVKPQVLPLLFSDLSRSAGKKWISIAAGISLDTLTRGLGAKNVIRFMPNMAAAIASSVTAVSPAPSCSEEFTMEALEIARTFGSAHMIDEKMMSAFTGLSGSGIATLFATLHHMAMGGVYEGFTYQQAVSIIAETAQSAAGIVAETGEHPQSLITKVCSPGGTTIEAMKVLEEEAFASSLMNSVIAASQKAKELEEIAKKREEKK